MKKKERLKYEKILRDLTLMSDTFSAEIFKHKECAEHLLRTLMRDETDRCETCGSTEGNHQYVG